jgi:hypothetical protein
MHLAVLSVWNSIYLSQRCFLLLELYFIRYVPVTVRAAGPRDIHVDELSM